MVFKHKIFFNAFTLAEILIVLGIIGLIADMTIPTLARNIQNQQLEAAFKTAYSSMSQAIGMMKVSEGQVYGVYSSYDNGNPMGFAFVFSKYFKNAVFTGGNNSSERLSFWRARYKTFHNGAVPGYFFDDGSFTIPNGMSIIFEAPLLKRTIINVDVNGYMKKPNRWGYDLFSFVVASDDNLYPAGSEKSKTDGFMDNDSGDYSDLTKYCSCSSTNSLNGVACAQRALTEKSYFKNLK